MAMSNPAGVGGGPEPVRARMLHQLGSCLAEWHRALAQGGRPAHPNLQWLRDFSLHLQPQLGPVGFGGIAFHLNELIRRAAAAGTSGDPRESLHALFELMDQARGSLSPEELAAHQRMTSADPRWSEAAQADGLWAPTGASSTIEATSSPPSLLGLRAFGARSSTPGGEASRQHKTADASGRHGGLLGLRRGSSGIGAAIPQAPIPSRAAQPIPLQSPPNGGARNVKELLGGIERSRGSRLEQATLELQRAKERRSAAGRSRNMRAIALTLTGIGLTGLVLIVVISTRRAGNLSPSTTTPSAAATALRGAPEQHRDAPSPPLLTEDETFSALLAQVHGRGKESSELSALVNEQAKLAARAVQTNCEGSAAECSESAKLREVLAGRDGQKRITRRRKTGSPDRVQSRWLVGLELPEIPIEDDPRVQRSLEYYTERPVGRELFQNMLFRCGAHRELIESTLIRHGLPKDLFAVVFVESGCEPEAVSPVGAAGLWQLMPDTARAYNLRVKRGVVDERRSAPKSTEAAVRFLRDLRDKMATYYPQGVWDLVFGAYNLGPFAMAARVEQAGGDVGFWDLVDAARLPEETVQFAPTIQAIALILRNLPHFSFAGVQLRAPQLTSDLEVLPGTRLSLIARAASTSLDRIRSLNLDITSDRTPDIPKFAVQVPKEVVWQARDTLAELNAAHDESDQCVPPGFDWGRKHFSKEMAAACQRKLAGQKHPSSKAAGPVAPIASARQQ